MTPPREHTIAVDGGAVRVLEWPGREPAALFLHGLTAVAEAWQPTVRRLRTLRRCIAIDQRGHGRTTAPLHDAAASAFARDVLHVLRTLDLDRPHLVGHSMGGRVAIVAGASLLAAFRSVAIVDIGPEAWRQNWVDTVAALDRARDVLGPGELDAILQRRGRDAETAATFASRFEPLNSGGHRALGDREAMKRIVRAQRSRNYWSEWESITLPLLLVRGARSQELRPRIAAAMRARNPSARFVEIPDVGHNIPLEAPAQLAAVLENFWASGK